MIFNFLLRLTTLTSLAFSLIFTFLTSTSFFSFLIGVFLLATFSSFSTAFFTSFFSCCASFLSSLISFFCSASSFFAAASLFFHPSFDEAGNFGLSISFCF
jgi:hypothetical protein